MGEVYCQELDTSVGKLWVAASSKGICRICFSAELSDQWRSWFHWYFSDLPQKDPFPLVKEATSQLKEYFSRKRTLFSLPLDLRGTSFQVRVWEELVKIPYGSSVSYGMIARRIGNPRGSRAIGAATARNPVPILVPCHRVIGWDGGLVGFGGGVTIKRRLLELEGSRLPFGAARSKSKGSRSKVGLKTETQSGWLPGSD